MRERTHGTRPPGTAYSGSPPDARRPLPDPRGTIPIRDGLEHPDSYSGRVKAELHDPRDQTLQVDGPTYRVHFWSEDGTSNQEWELSETDLDEVLAWIPKRALGRPHSLWVVTRGDQDVCLIRLRGIDLDAAESYWPSWAARTYSAEPK